VGADYLQLGDSALAFPLRASAEGEIALPHSFSDLGGHKNLMVQKTATARNFVES
jgi:hypothetical protein